jgi:hypothetical protein
MRHNAWIPEGLREAMQDRLAVGPVRSTMPRPLGTAGDAPLSHFRGLGPQTLSNGSLAAGPPSAGPCSNTETEA